MTTTTHFLNNGEDNFIFRIQGAQAMVITTNLWGGVEREEMTVEAARKRYGLAKKFGCVPGHLRHHAMRRLTTDAQFAAYTAANFDFDNNGNDAEAHLALEEEFAGQGYLEVAA
jgi:hypothetical protein